jgi:hypothetical protein
MFASELTFDVSSPAFGTGIGSGGIALFVSAEEDGQSTLTLRSLQASQLGSFLRCRKGRLRETDEGAVKEGWNAPPCP